MVPGSSPGGPTGLTRVSEDNFWDPFSFIHTFKHTFSLLLAPPICFMEIAKIIVWSWILVYMDPTIEETLAFEQMKESRSRYLFNESTFTFL